MSDAPHGELAPDGVAPPPESCEWVIAQAPERIAIATLEGALLYLNETARRSLGLDSAAPLTGKTLAQLQPGWAWEIVRSEGIPQALETGHWQGETAALEPGGGEIPVAHRLLICCQGAGDRRLASIMRDLTELKRRDLERIETMNRYETAIRLSGHVLLDWEPFTGDLKCSGDLPGVIGRNPGDLTAGFRTVRSFVHPDDLALFDREIQRSVTTRNSLSINFRIQHPDGDYRHVRAAGGFYLDREGRFGRITALLMNIDFLRHAREEVARLQAQLGLSAEEQVREARAEAQRANQAKSEFLSRMSHELRTPLNAILGFTQLLELETPTASQRESIEHIARAGHHLLSLINEVLDLTRIEAGRMPMNLEAVEIAPLVRETLELVRPAAEREEIALLHVDDYPPGAQRVIADQQRLRQVLMNLLSNAVKFNRRGGRVTVHCAPAELESVRISVTDTGAGIPADRLPQLFTPLERDQQREHERGGVGLGLALSRGIVQAMQGELGVESVPGQGSTFWVRLPEAKIERRAAPIEREPLPETTPRPLRQQTILYVEDEDLNLQLVKRVLADYPEYRLIATMQGSLALELAREHQPALILLDMNLPDVPGESILTHLKADPAVSHIPVIMVTADVLGHRLERFLQAGAASYLTKPFKIEEFIRAIRDTLK